MAPGGWTSRGNPGPWLRTPAILPNSAGRLDIFAAGSDKAMWHTAQTKASNGWQPPGTWSSLGHPAAINNLFSAPVAINNQGGKLGFSRSTTTRRSITSSSYSLGRRQACERPRSTALFWSRSRPWAVMRMACSNASWWLPAAKSSTSSRR